MDFDNIKLPIRLNKEPLIDVLFECRFSTSHPMSNILPGIFYNSFQGEEKKLEKLPQLEIPDFLRRNDPNLKYAPLVKVKMPYYSILVGDSSISISCNLPYRGWGSFKEIIKKVIDILRNTKLIDSIERFSLKYVDFIENLKSIDHDKIVNLNININGYDIKNEFYQLRMDVPLEDHICIIQVISKANISIQGKSEKNGIVVDIDTIKNVNNSSLEEFELDLDKKLEKMHLINKKMFFGCLSMETIDSLEPEYEQL